MRQIYIFLVRLPLGLIFAFILAKIFKPEMPFASIIIMGLLLTLFAYLLEFFRK